MGERERKSEERDGPTDARRSAANGRRRPPSHPRPALAARSLQVPEGAPPPVTLDGPGAAGRGPSRAALRAHARFDGLDEGLGDGLAAGREAGAVGRVVHGRGETGVGHGWCGGARGGLGGARAARVGAAAFRALGCAPSDSRMLRLGGTAGDLRLEAGHTPSLAFLPRAAALGAPLLATAQRGRLQVCSPVPFAHAAAARPPARRRAVGARPPLRRALGSSWTGVGDGRRDGLARRERDARRRARRDPCVHRRSRASRGRGRHEPQAPPLGDACAWGELRAESGVTWGGVSASPGAREPPSGARLGRGSATSPSFTLRRSSRSRLRWPSAARLPVAGERRPKPGC